MSRNQWFDGKEWGYECDCGRLHRHAANMMAFYCHCGHVAQRPACTLAKQEDVLGFGALAASEPNPQQHQHISSGLYSQSALEARQKSGAEQIRQNEQAWQQCYGPCYLERAAQKDEVARLRKELEAAQKRLASPEDGIPFEQHNAIQDDLKRVRAFSEDQARQIQALETTLAMYAKSVKTYMDATDEADAKVGRLTRELERAKRGKP